MPRHIPVLLRPILAATVPPLIASGVQSLFWSTLSPLAWILFYPTVLISSRIGGYWSGVGATFLSTALVWSTFLPLEGSQHFGEPRSVVSAGIFIATGLAFSACHSRLRKANESLKLVIDEHRIFFALIENSSDFIGIADADGKPAYLNPAGRRLVGLAEDYPVENTQLPDYYPRYVRSFASEVILKSMVEEGHWQGETYLRHWQTEEAIPVSDTHFMIRDPETKKILGMGTITRDISDVQRARNEVAENRKLQQVNQEVTRLYEAARRATQARDDMLGIVAHDLRNPLGTILMQTARLQSGTATPERRSPRPAETIKRAATRMNKLVQDLLIVTRMEGGQLPLDCERAPVARILLDVVETQEGLAAGASLALELDLKEPLPDVWVDGDRILQVFENLIGNAVKFSERGGRIVVGAKPGDGEVLFWVSDTGPGIAAEDIPHLFERFWQARQTKCPGAGLGLPIAKGIILAHRGRIWVESKPGRGTTFFFTIPTACRAAPKRSEAPPTTP